MNILQEPPFPTRKKRTNKLKEKRDARIIKEVKEGKYTISEIAQRHKVSKTTVQDACASIGKLVSELRPRGFKSTRSMEAKANMSKAMKKHWKKRKRQRGWTYEGKG